MNRRNFLTLAAAAVTGEALERLFPRRAYSFPSVIKIRDLYHIEGNSMYLGGPFYNGQIVAVYSPYWTPRGTFRWENGLLVPIKGSLIDSGDILVTDDGRPTIL